MIHVIMDLLPNEMLINVFEFLDGKSLSRAELVCKRWYDVLRLPSFEHTWRQKCLMELKPAAFYDMCNKNGSAAQIIFMRNWKLLFAKWYRSGNVKSWSYIKKVLCANFPIQCVTCFGKCVLFYNSNH